MPDVQRALLWRRLDQPGLEYFALAQDEQDWTLSGTIVVPLDGEPVLARYRVVCDRDWRTRAVAVSLASGAAERTLDLTVDDRQRWWRDGEELPTLRGCVECDIELTPATNTLPIRRLDLPVGASQELVAAWVRCPELRVEPLPQRYTRLASDRYRYESRGGRFVAELTVDDLGLVRRYGNIWERVSKNA